MSLKPELNPRHLYESPALIPTLIDVVSPFWCQKLKGIYRLHHSQTTLTNHIPWTQLLSTKVQRRIEVKVERGIAHTSLFQTCSPSSLSVVNVLFMAPHCTTRCERYRLRPNRFLVIKAMSHQPWTRVTLVRLEHKAAGTHGHKFTVLGLGNDGFCLFSG